jgi:hypothetical protein
MLTLLDQHGLRRPLIQHKLPGSFHASIDIHLSAVAALPHQQATREVQQKAATPVQLCPVSMTVPLQWADCLCHKIICSLRAVWCDSVHAYAGGWRLATLLQHHK